MMNSTQHIKQLIQLFFDGETTLEQEQELYAYFKQGDCDAELQQYRLFFADLSSLDAPGEDKVPLYDDSVPLCENSVPLCEHSVPLYKPRVRNWMRVAAVCLLVTGIAGFGLNRYEKYLWERQFAGSYMVVNGERLTNSVEVRKQINATLALADQIMEVADASQFVENTEEALINSMSDSEERQKLIEILSD